MPVNRKSIIRNPPVGTELQDFNKSKRKWIPADDSMTNCIFARMKILMVCLGNICRSPLAEGILQQKAKQAGLNWQVESAGTNGYHDGEAPHPLSQKAALKNGVDISKQRSRRFTAADMEQYDMIYALAGDVMYEIRRIAGKKFDPAKTDLLMNVQYPGSNRDVPDPWSGPERGYHDAFAMISKACDAIIEKYTAQSIKY